MTVEVFRVTPLPGDHGGPVTAWAGPSSDAAQAVRVAARVLRLPPSMRVRVEIQRLRNHTEDPGGPPVKWEPICTTTVDAASAGSG